MNILFFLSVVEISLILYFLLFCSLVIFKTTPPQNLFHKLVTNWKGWIFKSMNHFHSDISKAKALTALIWSNGSLTVWGEPSRSFLYCLDVLVLGGGRAVDDLSMYCTWYNQELYIYINKLTKTHFTWFSMTWIMSRIQTAARDERTKKYLVYCS